MQKLIGIAKLGAAALLFLSIVFTLSTAFSADDLAMILVGSAFLLLLACVYGLYLVRTGLRDLKRLPVQMTGWLVPGILIHMVCCVLALYAAARNLAWYGSLIPAALIGLFIGIKDALAFFRARNRSEGIDPAVSNVALEPGGSLEFSVTISQQEWVRFVFQKSYDHPMILWITIIGLGMGIGALFALVSGSEYPLFGLVFSGLFTLSILVGLPWSMWRNAVRQHQEEKWVAGPLHYSITRDGIKVTGQGVELKQDRGAVTIEEFKGWFILKTGRATGLYIPMRVLDDMQSATFRSLLQDP